jgi:hypothetical protein
VVPSYLERKRKIYMDMFKRAFRTAVAIVVFTLAAPAGVRVVSADHRESPQVYLLFDGINDYVEVKNYRDLSVATTGQLTVAAWMKPATLYFPTTEGNGYVHWLGKGGPTQQEWAFRMYSKDTTHSESPRRCDPSEPFITTRQNRVSFYVFNLEGGLGVGSYFQYGYTRCDLLSRPIMAGEWIHVVGIADGTQTHIFRNGIRMDSDAYSGTITPTAGEAPLRLGTREVGESHFLGGLAEVRIWNRALSESEVSDLHHLNIVPGGLVGEWLLNEEIGTTALDTISAHNGTIFGAYRPVR